MHIRIKDYPEKINQALLLTDDRNNLLSVRDFLSVIGLDFYFDGRSAIKIYPEMAAADFLKAETQEKVWRYFPRFFWDSLEVTSLFGFGFSKANNNPVLYYHLKNQQDLTTYFKINDTAQRVHSFYQHQDILPNMWVGTAQQELEKTRRENIAFLIHKRYIPEPEQLNQQRFKCAAQMREPLYSVLLLQIIDNGGNFNVNHKISLSNLR